MYFGLWNKMSNYWYTANGALVWYPDRLLAEIHQGIIDGCLPDPRDHQWEVREFSGHQG